MSATSAIARSSNRVSTGPGSTTTTRIPKGESSTRSESEIDSSACLAEQYGAANGTVTLPPTEDMLTIVPPPAARSAGSAARMVSIAPKTATSYCSRHRAAETSSVAPYCA
ncbi:MAG TPA: hypothetical protein VMQ61_16560 [Thermoanaerobaculia bacterium]|nr:hypothetical protein [Thermoanaerobaculia bacterium]